MKKILILIGILAILAGAIYIWTQSRPVIRKSVTVKLSVMPKPDFILSVDTTWIESPIGRVVPIAITVTSVNGFAGDITFSVSGLPNNFIITWFPSDKLTLGPDMPRGVQLNIEIPDDPKAVGDYDITISAESTIYN